MDISKVEVYESFCTHMFCGVFDTFSSYVYGPHMSILLKYSQGVFLSLSVILSRFYLNVLYFDSSNAEFEVCVASSFVSNDAYVEIQS